MPRRVYRFTKRNIGRRVDIQFAGERLSTLMIGAPVSSGLVTLGTEHSEAQVDKIFAPLGSKLSWKRDGRT